MPASKAQTTLGSKLPAPPEKKPDDVRIKDLTPHGFSQTRPTLFRWNPLPSNKIISVEVIGEPDIGKTRFCARALAEVDKNGKVLKTHSAIGDTEQKAWIEMEKIQNTRWKKVLTLQDMREFVDVCLKDPECKVVAMDSGSDIRQMAETEFCLENGLKKVFPIVLYGRVFAKIDEIIMRLHDAGKHFICTSRIKDEFEDDVRTGRRIRDSYKKFPYQLPILIVLQRGIRDQAGRVWFDNHVFAEVYKNNFFKLYKEKAGDQITKPWLFDVTFEGLVKELVDNPWDEKNIIFTAHQFLHEQKIQHDEKDTDKLKP